MPKQHRLPSPSIFLPPAKAERLRQAFLTYMLMAGLCWLWEVEDVEDVPILSAATDWFGELSWPRTAEDLWTGPPLLERRPAGLVDESSPGAR